MPPSGTTLSDKVDLRNFAYDQCVGLKEEAVKEATAEYLRSRGYRVFVARKHDRGPDVRASLGDRRVLIEAKGECRLPQSFTENFLTALGQTITRITTTGVDFGIALPAHRTYVRMAEDLPDFARHLLRIHFYFVRPGKDGKPPEVACFPFDAR